MIQRRIWVSGRVQGVGFRMSALKAAESYPTLKGLIRNLSDGRVEAVFAGKQGEVLAMAAWCKKGPPPAKVSSITIQEEPYDESLPNFKISSVEEP